MRCSENGAPNSADEPPAYALDFPPAGIRPHPRRRRLAPRSDRLDRQAVGIWRHHIAELVSRSLSAIADQNDELYAFVEILEVEALARAKKMDVERGSGRVRSALHGIPVSVKDLYAVKGGTTRAGSLGYERRDDHDAVAVKRLREAGAVVIGKTSTHEFAMGVTAPQSRNPHDVTRIAGGSSSGAAIAVATGMGMAALGTDTRGSIRIPAALCGVVGLKPTFGTIPLDGVVPLAWSMDHVGVMAASADDAVTVLDALTPGTRPLIRPVAAVSDIRVGLPRTAWQGAEPASSTRSNPSWRRWSRPAWR